MLTLKYTFLKDSHDRFKIEVTSSQVNSKGKMKVELGGNVKETIAVEVTNLILSEASLIWRLFLSNRIASAISSLSEPISQDIQLFCPNSTGQCLKLNTTLVTSPILANNTLLLQINAAPYITG